MAVRRYGLDGFEMDELSGIDLRAPESSISIGDLSIASEKLRASITATASAVTAIHYSDDSIRGLLGSLTPSQRQMIVDELCVAEAVEFDKAKNEISDLIAEVKNMKMLIQELKAEIRGDDQIIAEIDSAESIVLDFG